MNVQNVVLHRQPVTRIISKNRFNGEIKMTYECEKSKEWNKIKPTNMLPLCCYCYKFMDEADACLENSTLAPLYRRLHPESKPCSFSPRNEMIPEVVLSFYYNDNSKISQNNVVGASGFHISDIQLHLEIRKDCLEGNEKYNKNSRLLLQHRLESGMTEDNNSKIINPWVTCIPTKNKQKRSQINDEKNIIPTLKESISHLEDERATKREGPR